MLPVANIGKRQRALSRYGIAWYASRVKMRDISDGTTNTFMFFDDAHFAWQSSIAWDRGSNPFFMSTIGEGYGMTANGPNDPANEHCRSVSYEDE